MRDKKKPKPSKKIYQTDPSVFGENSPTLHDLMAVADGIQVKDTEIFVSPSGFTKIYYVTGLPSTIHFGYLNRFFNVGADVHVTLHVEPADSQLAISKRTKMMTKIEAEIIAERKAGTNKNISFHENEYALLEKEREELRLGMERLFYTTIIFSVSSPDRDEFNSACELIEREGFEGFMIRAAYKEHDLGFRSVAPIGENVLRHPIEMTASALANAFPFTNSRFSHEYGVPIGVDFSSGHMNRYDAWHPDVANANAVVIGTSGAGKSYLLKGIIARSAAFGVRHAIVDYEGEYTATVRALGGKSIRIDERSPYRMNPFELEEEEEKLPDGSIRKFVEVKEKISEMERLIVSMAQLYTTDQLDGYTISVVNDILQSMYEVHFGFTSDPESLYERKTNLQRNRLGDRLVLRVKRPQPRFSDFYGFLEKRTQEDPRLEEILMRLRRFKEGGTEGMFDCYSNVELSDEPIIHFDLSSLSEKSLARKLGMQVTLEWLIEKFVKKSANVRKRVLTDETQKMLESEDHAQFIEDVFRRIRKRGGSAIAASQDARKFVDNPHGRAIVQNSATKVLMKQDKNDKKSVMDVFGIEPQEFDDMVGYSNGQARWQVEKEVFYNQLTVFDEEHELYTTRFVQSEHELAMQRGRVL